MTKTIIEHFQESIRVKQGFLRDNLETLTQAIDVLVRAFQRGNKLLLFGNGGSAADAQHIAAEFVNRFMIERPPLPALDRALAGPRRAAAPARRPHWRRQAVAAAQILFDRSRAGVAARCHLRARVETPARRRKPDRKSVV